MQHTPPLPAGGCRARRGHQPCPQCPRPPQAAMCCTAGSPGAGLGTCRCAARQPGRRRVRMGAKWVAACLPISGASTHPLSLRASPPAPVRGQPRQEAAHTLQRPACGAGTVRLRSPAENNGAGGMGGLFGTLTRSLSRSTDRQPQGAGRDAGTVRVGAAVLNMRGVMHRRGGGRCWGPPSGQLPRLTHAASGCGPPPAGVCGRRNWPSGRPHPAVSLLIPAPLGRPHQAVAVAGLPLCVSPARGQPPRQSTPTCRLRNAQPLLLTPPPHPISHRAVNFWSRGCVCERGRATWRLPRPTWRQRSSWAW